MPRASQFAAGRGRRESGTSASRTDSSPLSPSRSDRKSSGWRRRVCASLTTHGRTRRRAVALRRSRPCAAAGIQGRHCHRWSDERQHPGPICQFGPVSMFQKLLGHSRKPMPAAQVIRMATLEGAQVLGLDSQIGSLESGKKADIIRIDLLRRECSRSTTSTRHSCSRRWQLMCAM